VAGRIVSFLSIPVIVRMVSRADYGSVQVFVTMFAFLVLIRDFGFDSYYIVKNKTGDKQLLNTFVNALCINCFVSGGLLLILAGPLAGWMNISHYADYFRLLIPLLFLSSIETISLNYFREKVLFKRIAIGQSIRFLSYPLLSLLFIWVSPGFESLYAAFCISTILVAGYYAVIMPERKSLLITIRGLRSGFKTMIGNRAFLFNSGIGVVISNLSYSLPIYFFSGLVSLEHTAMYSLAFAVVARPISLLLIPVSRVAFPAMTHLSDEKIRAFILKMTGLSAIAVYPVLIWVILYAPDICAVFLGPKYQNVTLLIRLICIPFFMSVVSLPLMGISMVKDKPQIYVYWAVVNIAVVIATLYAGLQIGFVTSVMFFAIGRFVTLFFWQVITCRLSGLPLSRLVYNYGKYLPVWMVIAAVGLAFQYTGGLGIAAPVIAGFSMIGVYALLLYKLHRGAFNDITGLIRKPKVVRARLGMG
jgi:O-antigen/teichoic acid export membrane protein